MDTKVLKINGHDVSNFSETELCDFYKTKWKEITKQTTIKLLILQDNEEREIEVNKVNFKN